MSTRMEAAVQVLHGQVSRGHSCLRESVLSGSGRKGVFVDCFRDREL